MKPKYWKQACDHLCRNDATLANIILSYKGESLRSQANAFQTLANAIVGQQISAKAAEAVWKRFYALFPRGDVSYKNFLKIKHEDLRAAGLSASKVVYITNIANYFKANKITEEYFFTHPPEKIHAELLAIKGIGKWTLEMFRIFYLLEPDIFPINDLGVIKAIQKHYPPISRHVERQRRDKAISKLAKKWEPYRTVATWYLWRTFDTEPVAY